MFFFLSCLVAEKINIRQTFFFLLGHGMGPEVQQPNGARGARRGGSRPLEKNPFSKRAGFGLRGLGPQVGSGYGKIQLEPNPLPFIHNAIMKHSNVKKKNKGTTKCEKIIVKCDVRTIQCEDGTIKCEKKVREPPNVRKELSHVMLVLCNVKMVPLNVRKKIREPLNLKKVQSHVMLVLHM